MYALLGGGVKEAGSHQSHSETSHVEFNYSCRAGEDGSTEGYGAREINNRVCGKQRIWSEDG